MTPDITQLAPLTIVAIFAIREFFLWQKSRKNSNGNYTQALSEINEKLTNHLTTVNGKISDIERNMADLKMDVKIIRNSVEDIKIKLK